MVVNCDPTFRTRNYRQFLRWYRQSILGRYESGATSSAGNDVYSHASSSPCAVPDRVRRLARDGKFEFTVTGFECGLESVGESPFGEQAQGQLCLLHVRVQNIGTEAQSLFPGNQYLLSADAVEYSASGTATFSHDPEAGFFADINPGNAVDGTIVFDVPPDAAITHARLHDSAFSGGVLVNLT